MTATRPLRRAFYVRPTLTVARELIGLYLVHQDGAVRRVGRIVEAEAYQGPHDLAAHSARGLTPRTRVMFGPPGHAYVYLIYGFWNCLNVVTAREGVPHAVLLRALEPVANLDGPAWGPGLLCRAMHIDRRLNGADLCGGVLWIERSARRRRVRITRTTRIGVDYAGDWAGRPWRFYESASPYVSTLSSAARERALRASGLGLRASNLGLQAKTKKRKARGLLPARSPKPEARSLKPLVRLPDKP